MNRNGDDDDRSAFRDAVGDVKPLTTKRRDASRPPATPTPGVVHRRAAAAADPAAADVDERLTLGEVPVVAPGDIVGWKRNGVQDGVFKNLRLGRYPIEGSLDLHRKTVKEARAAVLAFTRLAQAKGWRSVLISHGRGERSPTPARIKSYVLHWLEQMDEVLAFHSAERRHGGAGSVYVLLRKSAAAREANRERHGLKTSP
jgi:DNA-nicking Smr family endonuclease